MDFESRIVTAQYAQEDGEIEASLRPRTLADYIGQEKAKENLSIYIEAQGSAVSRSTMCCSTDRRGWARRPFRTSSPTRCR
jgi:hypothetical protein